MKVQRLSTDARVAMLHAARAEATARGDRYVGTEHLLLGLLAEPGGVAERALEIGLDEMRAALRRFDGEALDAVGVDVVLPAATGRAVVRRRLR